ncbi:unnamed protein product [Lathyrus sativus]|nr:unnamed protein product [Lathyrus sativus]
MAAYRQPMTISDRAPTSPQTPHSPWHSPVPYLFGGLAAMLGLIAFALLILACSYWKLSGYLEGNGESERDLEAGQATNDTDEKPQKPYEEKILVIMAGQEKPTFLATPRMSSSVGTSRSSSFGDNTSTCTCDQNQKSKENLNDDADNDNDEGDDGDSSVKQGSGGENRVGRTESVERTATETTTITTDQNV